MKTLKAFTLIEVLLVVLILALLSSIVVPRIGESAAEAKATKCDSNRANLISALERYVLDNNGKFPANQAEFNAQILKNTTYFPHGSPTCPYGHVFVYNNTLKTVDHHILALHLTALP